MKSSNSTMLSHDTKDIYNLINFVALLSFFGLFFFRLHSFILANPTICSYLKMEKVTVNSFLITDPAQLGQVTLTFISPFFAHKSVFQVHYHQRFTCRMFSVGKNTRRDGTDKRLLREACIAPNGCFKGEQHYLINLIARYFGTLPPAQQPRHQRRTQEASQERQMQTMSTPPAAQTENAFLFDFD